MEKITKTKLILLVEDEKHIIIPLQQKLIERGYEVAVALDGREGTNLALARHPDLILLDLLMPKFDGISMLKDLRQDAWGAKAQVIILTNVNDPSRVAEGMEAGLNGVYEYLIKTDWTLDNLINKIDKKLK